MVTKMYILEFLKLQKTTFSNTVVFKSHNVVQTLHGIMALQNQSISQNHDIFINFENTLYRNGILF